MTDQAVTAHPTGTGVDDVDAVLDHVATVEQRPLEEHVTVFESAHDALRRVLDATPKPS